MACQTKPRGPSPRVQSQSLGDGPPFNSKPPNGCILAPSVEAKLWGVKTGMTLSAGRTLCPWLIARVADPPKYRQVHSELAILLRNYSPHVISKSIDEFIITLPNVTKRTVPKRNARVQLEQGSPAGEGTVLTGIVQDIKSRIKSEIGDYLRVSIGVSTNQILAKLVAKATRRMRSAGYSASGVHLALRYGDGTAWHAGHNTPNLLFDDVSLLASVLNLYNDRVTTKLAERSVKKIAFTCLGLAKQDGQLSVFTDIVKQNSLTTALDALNSKWGEYSISYGSMLGSAGHIHDAIAFGK
ncbi:hypothetical protein COT54_00720 [Candidatus Collierbacteria bacterium CG09_land_8_20_14_0_10_46_12]|uniref:UmuC domain-containing protein n=1 Tax=Candidatus Collierbacteria bacterium CG09_land_8_20_14_0_10_46_12 TaxID=1974533 RepID=A0A2H0X1X1_9BACT|nr:MAG: hypothetical protein COT54_00720 [Candidatus Collierbacteria bacterium CG09_land_8_20_14_0_10_46_12]